MANTKITRQLSIYINDKEIKNSLGGIGRAIGAVKSKLKEANDPEKIIEYKKELDLLKNKYGEVKEEIYGTNKVLEDAKGHWENLKNGLLTGNLSEVSKGLKGITSNVKNITKAAWAFIKTPFGAALAVLATVGTGVKKWVDYNLEIEKTNQLIRDLTQQTGDAVDYIRIRAEVLKKTFDTDINTSVETSKSLAKSFGISYQEAFDIIEDGAVRGKLSNDDYLASLKEYPVQFKNAGFSAKEFADIVSAGVDLSIYQDKLPDAIKEFNLSITEQTKASKDALENAFGSNFTDKLLKGIQSGSISTKEALSLISEEAKTIGLNSQQAQQLTADLFKGAGEDAGGALKIFEAVNLALNEQKKPLTDIQKVQKEQLDTNKELNKVYTALFASGSKGFSLWIQKGKLFATQTLLKILKGGVDVYNWFVDLNNESGAFSAVLTGIGKAASFSFSSLGVLITAAKENLKGLGDIVAGIFTFDIDRIKKGFSKGVDAISSAVTKIKLKTQEDAKDIYKAFKGDNKLEKISLNDLVENPTTTEEEKPSVDYKTTQSEKKKFYEESEKELNDLLSKIQQERLNKSKDKFSQELFAIDEKYNKLKEKFILSEEEKKGLTLEQIKSREDAINSLEDQKAREKHELKKQRDLEFAEELKEIELENQKLEAEEKFNKEAEAAATEEQKALVLLKKAKFIADEELKIALDKELAKVKFVEDAEKIKDAIKKKYRLKQNQIDKAHEKAVTKLKAQEAETTKATEAEKFNSIKQGLGQAADAFNKGSAGWKAMKISETVMATYQGAQNAFNSLSKIPVVGVPLGIAAAAAAVKAGISRVGMIKNTSLEKVPKHYYGGPTGKKAIFNDEYGAVTGVVHDDEWVAPKFMTQSPKYAPTLRWLEKERKANLGLGFFDGGSTSTDTYSSEPLDNIDSEETQLDSNSLLIAQLNSLNNHLRDGIKAIAIIGDDNIEELRNRENKLVNSRLNAKIE